MSSVQGQAAILFGTNDFPALATQLCGIALRNPVIAASGTFAYGVEFVSVTDLESIGAFIVKGISRNPMPGNPEPRVWEAEGGMINSIGLQNIGVEAFLREKVPSCERSTRRIS